MRTRIEIDDRLMQEVLRITGLKTKGEAVQLALLTLLRVRRQDEIRRFRGEADGIGTADATPAR
jgi:Arc/MetJ family transcription regulator